MIEQRINLYQERFRKKRLVLSAAQLASMVVLSLITITIWSQLLQTDLDDAIAFNAALKARQSGIADELNAANAELTRLLADNRMDQQITGVSREISARRRILSFVDANQFGAGRGFSSYLVSLSRLHVDNLWLDEINLTENYVRIHGSALDAALVPTYFDRFSEEAAFKGNRFDLFQLERLPATDWKVDFEIATSEALHE
ncbi:MAG: hypothetical protein GY820_26245 [Gammaproteobacteria bacterium]|nr:hypothetical protein [Gammaproteobacteria bacterium]